MQSFGVECVGQRLRAGQVGDAQEGVVLPHELDAFSLERTSQGAVAVAVELQPEWRTDLPMAASVEDRIFVGNCSTKEP